MNAPVLALDLGGTKIAAALLELRDHEAVILERASAPTPSRDRSPESVLEACLAVLAPFVPRAGALAVASTGSVAAGRVTALNADTLQGWDAVNVQGMLGDRTKLPCVVLNDADAAAWGEHVYGAGRGAEEFVFVTVSTGVGAGLVLGGVLYQTKHGRHAELGYTLAPNGRPLEVMASGTALDQYAHTRGWENARDVVLHAQSGDVSANAVLDESARLVAHKLADLYATVGVDVAAVGGGLGLAQGYVQRIDNALHVLGDPWKALRVRRAELGVDAGLVGAAHWAQHLAGSSGDSQQQARQ